MEQIKYDVFISYSRKDYVDEQNNVIPGNEVSKIKEALTKAGICKEAVSDSGAKLSKR